MFFYWLLLFSLSACFLLVFSQLLLSGPFSLSLCPSCLTAFLTFFFNLSFYIFIFHDVWPTKRACLPDQAWYLHSRNGCSCSALAMHAFDWPQSQEMFIHFPLTRHTSGQKRYKKNVWNLFSAFRWCMNIAPYGILTFCTQLCGQITFSSPKSREAAWGLCC